MAGYFQRSWDGVWLNRSPGEVKCKSPLSSPKDWLLRYIKSYLYFYLLSLILFQEYNYEAIQKFADLYDNVVKKVVNIITESVNSFKKLIETFRNTKFSDILRNLIESVKQLPAKVFNLRRIGKRLYKAIGKFVELPPVVTQVKGLVTKVTTLFNDIKTDVMKLYNVSRPSTSSGSLIIQAP